jgi:hypothetical protein
VLLGEIVQSNKSSKRDKGERKRFTKVKTDTV